MKTQIEQIKDDIDIAKHEITKAIDKLKTSHEDISFDIKIYNEIAEHLNGKTTNYYVVNIRAKI